MWNSYSDILVLVLIRLPPKSLGRCKSVSKSWKVLISSSEFIRFHLQYQSSIRKKPGVLLCRNIFRHSRVTGHETFLAEYSMKYENWENLELGCEIQQLYNPYESHAPGMASMLVGSCDGLLCQILCVGLNLKHHSIYGEFVISLCNPLTKLSWVLPESPLFLNVRDGPGRVVSYGFGYDDVDDTYKVLLVTGPPYDEYGNKYGPKSQPDAKYEYQVYSLRRNKWIVVSLDVDYFHDYFITCQKWDLEGVLVNCALHWILYNAFGPCQDKKVHYILAFDLRTDKHKIMRLPEDVEDECFKPLLSVLNGCLLLSDKCFSQTNTREDCIFEIWVMKDYGLRDSWTRIRICNSQYHLSYISPVLLLEDNHHPRKKLIYHDIRGRDQTILLYYDTESHQVVEFPAPPSGGAFDKVKQLQFIASLVQPHPPSFGGQENIYQSEEDNA